MKKFLGILIVLVILAVPTLIVRYAPRTCIPSSYETIQEIHVFDGSSGNKMTITDADTMEWIVDAFRGDKLKRAGSAHGMGTSFRMTFTFEEGTVRFVLQGPKQIKLGYSFFEPVEEENYIEVFDYLWSTLRSHWPVR